MAEGTTRYEIEIGNERIKFEGPSGLTDEQIEHLADKYLKTAKPGQHFKPSEYVGSKDNPPADASGESSAWGSFLRGLTKDSTFNFGDEFASVANAAIPGLAELDNLMGVTTEEQQGPLSGGDFWERVRGNMGASKRQEQADEQLHPVASGTGRIAGVLSTLPRAAAAIAARLPEAAAAQIAARPVLSTVTAGTAGGAVSGAGAGEQGTRAQSAAIGAGTGLVTAGAIRAGGELAPWLARNGRVLLNKGIDSEATRQIIQALGRDGFDIVSPGGIQKIKAALQQFTGKPVSLADLGGASRARTGVGLRDPNAMQQQSLDAIRSRQAGQGQRLAGDVRATVAPRTDVHTLDEQLVEQRATEAARLRDRALFVGGDAQPALPANDVGTSVPAFPAPIGVSARNPTSEELLRLGPAGRDTAIGTPKGNGRVVAFMQNSTVNPPTMRARVHLEDGSRHTFDIGDLTEARAAPPPGRQSRIVDDEMLQQLARLPFAQRALGHALDLSESERVLLAAQGKSIDHLPDLNRGSDLDVRTFDTLKRYLDNEVNTLYKRGVGNTYSAAEAAQVKDLRNAIRDRLRVAVPEYGEYLDAYKGSSEMIDSLEAGQSYDKLPPELISAGQAQRSTAGQELFRVGAARNLLDTIRETKDTGNAASRILNSDESRAQLAATGVAPANAAALNRSAAQERQLNLLPQELSGSQTNQRAMAQTDATVGADINVPFNPGSPVGWGGMFARKLLATAGHQRNKAVNEALLPQMLETNPAAIEAIITKLEQQGNITAAKTLRRQVLERRAALWGGTAIGSPVALHNEER